MNKNRNKKLETQIDEKIRTLKLGRMLLVLLKKSLTFFIISVKIDLENKVIGFQFESKRSVFNHEGFCQYSSDER